MNKTNGKKKLVQIKMASESYQELERLQRTTGLATISEIIRYSISLFRWIVEKQRSGYEIYAVPSKDKEGKGDKIELLLLHCF